MAKPIEPTPVLRGKDAVEFIEDMKHPERITDSERKLILLARKVKSQII